MEQPNAEAGKGIETGGQTGATQDAVHPAPAETTPPPAQGEELQHGAIPTDEPRETPPPDGGEGNPPAEGDADDAPPPEYNLEIPQGFTVDEGNMSAFKQTLGKYKIPEEGAKEIFGLFQKEAARQREADFQGMLAMHKEGYARIANDPKIGGENLDNSRRLVGMALRRFGDADTVKAIKRMGAANSYEIFTFIRNVGESIDEPGHDASERGGRAAAKRLVDELYHSPNLN